MEPRQGSARRLATMRDELAGVATSAASLDEIRRWLEARPNVTRVELRLKLIKTHPPRREFVLGWLDDDGAETAHVVAVSESLGVEKRFALVDLRREA